MPRRVKPGKIWIPRDHNTKYTIYIDSVDVSSDVLSAEFTNGIIGVESPCKIELIDTDGTYANKYSGGEVIEFQMDFSAGTTSQWKGKLNKPNVKYTDKYSVDITGSHYQSDLLDITVTEEYDGSITDDNILKELVSKYLTGYTTTNVTASTHSSTLKWENKSFYDCVLDLCNNSDFDCYLDTDKDFHFFERESIENTTDAIIWNDNLISAELGTDDIEVRNKIITYGEDNAGLPIIYTTNDTSSQTDYGVKEKIVKDGNIKTYLQAKEVGDAELANLKSKSTSGKAEALFMPDINPGDMIWISNPVQHIHNHYRIIKYTYKLPLERTLVTISKEKTIPTLFKERRMAEQSVENLSNPHKCLYSVNIAFDDPSDLGSNSSNVEVSEGNLKTITGNNGTFISNLRTADDDITRVYLKVIGDTLIGNTYSISTNNGVSWTDVSLETLEEVPSGKELLLKITITSASMRLDSIVVMYK